MSSKKSEKISSKKCEKMIDELIMPVVLKKKNSAKGSLIIGYIEEIHGKGQKKSVEITKFEAAELLKIWIRKRQEVEDEWDCGMSSSSGIRMYPYSNMRINEIVESEILDSSEVDEIFDKMYEGRVIQ